MASFDSKVGSFAMATITGNQSVSGLGFQPKALIVYASQRTSDGSQLHDEISQGMAISSSEQWAFGSTAESSTGNDGAGKRIDEALIIIVNGGSTSFAVQASADLVSMDSDGFTINWTTNDGTARIINYMALGGDSLEVDAGLLSAPTSNGTQAVTTSFEPDLVFFIGHSDSAVPGEQSYAEPSIGFAVDATNERTQLASYTDQAHSSRLQRSDRILTNIEPFDGTYYFEAQFDSKSSTSFTLDWVTTSAFVPKWAWLALRGVTLKLGSFSQGTSTGNQSITGVGFIPGFVLLSGFNSSATSSVLQAAKSFVGAVTSTSERFALSRGSDARAAEADKSTNLDRAVCLKHITGGNPSPTIDSVADFVSFDSDGFTINNTTVDATSREVIFFAIEAAAAGGGDSNKMWLFF